ncbi:hypothetical protein BH23GEM7_BH23GEM7_12010 [soil metagenome]|nr:hypothetical protein [Gemmatimonadota bacterium]
MNQPVPAARMPRPLVELCDVAELEEEARALLGDREAPRDFIAALVDQERYADAIRLLAHALPKREAIWWAWTSARQVLDGDPPLNIRAALDATERWIRQPSEETRRPMLRIAEEADLGTPAGCAALAVFLSGGSIAPPEAPPVEPNEFAAAKAIAGSIVLAAVSTEPETAPAKFRGFIDRGVDIASRIDLWPAVKAR